MKDKLDSSSVDFLIDAVLSLKSRDEAAAFFDDLLTVAELKSMSQRLEVARMLQNRETYQDISVKTGASTATISRVARALNYGKGGYNTVLGRII
ncbi:MAG: hypothetical protein K6G57_03255 [Lachnospiraceae bacterium]|nr:hypothetical protein [Lachnospiraceae bacterium]